MLQPYQSKEYFTYREEISSRIKWLFEHGKYLEALFLYSAAVELELDKAIEANESWAAYALKQKGISFRMSEFRASQLPKMTLGSKHKYLKVFLSEKSNRDALLDTKLGEFIALRNKASHDLSKRDLVKLEEEILNSKLDIEVKVLTFLRTKRWAIEAKVRRSNGQLRRRGKPMLHNLNKEKEAS
jgi:hypothetical protein